MGAYRLMKEVGNQKTARDSYFQAECVLSTDCPEPSLLKYNLIVLGNSRINEVLREKQRGWSFQLGEHTIKVLGKRKKGEKREYFDDLRDSARLN